MQEIDTPEKPIENHHQSRFQEKDTIDKIIDLIFSTKKTTFILILIMLLAFILRSIAAINLPVTADDMHHVTYAVNFYDAGRLITYEQSSGLWHAFTSIIYKFLGTTQLASRTAALIFGTFSILAIYLLTREFFKEKTALLAAFLLAIAPFHIKNTIAEMDVMAMFFVLVSMFLFIKALKSEKTSLHAMSGIFLGLGIYTKVYPLLFVPSYILYFAYFKRKNNQQILSKKSVKLLAMLFLIAAIFAIPTLTHNYLLYKDKGFVDLHFTRTLGLGKDISEQYYGFDAAFHRTSSWSGLIFGDTRHIVSGTPLLLGAADFIRQSDPINFYLGILGIFIILLYQKDKKNYLIFFLISLLFIFPFLAANILLSKHYLFLELLLVPLSAFSVYKINNKLSNLLKKDSTKITIIILLLFSLFLLGLPSTGVSHIYGKSHISQMIEFKEESISENALVVADSRMYRGRINWVFQGRPYLEGTYFIQLLNAQEELQGNLISAEVYFFECLPDDCGWGTVKDQPEFNASMEALTELFKQKGVLIKTLSEPNRQKKYYPILFGDKIETIAIYKSNLILKDSIIAIANQPKNWWLYDIGFEPKERQFDYYEVNGLIDTLLNKLAHWIVSLALLLAFLSPFYILYLIYER